jgi:hypothetical protein
VEAPGKGLAGKTPAGETLTRAVSHVGDLPGKSDWRALSREVEAALGVPRLDPTVRVHLLAVRAQLRPMKALGELREVLVTGGMKKLEPDALDHLPEPVRRLWLGLEGLDDIGANLARPRAKAPDAAALGRRLRDVQVATGNDRLTAELQGALIGKAEREGHRGVARVLRDLKLEEVPAGASATPRVPVPPLVPEAPAGARPGQYESVWEGLPELKEPATKAARQLYQNLRAHASWHYEFRYSLTHTHTHLARHLQRLTEPQEGKDRDERRERLVSVRARLGRPLTPAERIIAADMVQRGKDAETVTSDLKRTLRDRMLSRPERAPTREFQPWQPLRIR